MPKKLMIPVVVGLLALVGTVAFILGCTGASACESSVAEGDYGGILAQCASADEYAGAAEALNPSLIEQMLPKYQVGQWCEAADQSTGICATVPRRSPCEAAVALQDAVVISDGWKQRPESLPGLDNLDEASAAVVRECATVREWLAAVTKYTYTDVDGVDLSSELDLVRDTCQYLSPETQPDAFEAEDPRGATPSGYPLCSAVYALAPPKAVAPDPAAVAEARRGAQALIDSLEADIQEARRSGG